MSSECEPHEPDDPYPGRRQLDSLTPADLEACGVWWFPGPDGHLSGPDAGTVMPLDTAAATPDGSLAFPDGKYLLRTVVRLADGSECTGHLTYATDDDGSLRDREPTLVAAGGQVPLWHGVVVPDAERIAEYLSLLGRERDAVFPLAWHAAFHPPEDDLGGTLDGFAITRDDAIASV